MLATNDLEPFYPLSIAAGSFAESSVPAEPEAWVKMDGLSGRSMFSSSMFVARVQGRSMESQIPDGACCLFTFDVGGKRTKAKSLASYIQRYHPACTVKFAGKVGGTDSINCFCLRFNPPPSGG